MSGDDYEFGSEDEFGGGVFGESASSAADVKKLRAQLSALQKHTDAQLDSFRIALRIALDRVNDMKSTVDTLLKIADANPDAAREMAVQALEKLYGNGHG